MKTIRIKDLRNSLSFRVTIAMLIIGIIPLIIYFTINRIALQNSFFNIEKEAVCAQASHTQIIMRSQSKRIEDTARDYAIWDDTYEYVSNNNPTAQAFFQENFTTWLTEELDINLILVINSNREIVTSYGLKDLLPGKQLSNKNLLKILSKSSCDRFPNGLLRYGEDVYIIGVSPILPQSYKGSSRGVVLLGKKITPAFLNYLKSHNGYDISFIVNDAIISTTESKETLTSYYDQHADKIKQGLFMDIKTGKSICSKPMNDILNNPIGYVAVLKSEDLILNHLYTINQNKFIILALSLLLIMFLSMKLKKFITGPIHNLEQQLTKMEIEQELGTVDIKGPQEIMNLAHTFNEMAAHLLEHKKQNEALKSLSITDNLTSLYNHRHFYEYCSELMLTNGKKIVLLYCDIDLFKTINDTYGHIAGDYVLKEIAAIIQNKTKRIGTSFRYGGEELIVILEDFTMEQAYKIAEEIRLAILNSAALQAYSYQSPVSISCGLASYPTQAENIKDLVNRADMAMYHAKKNGRNQSVIYSEELETEG